MKNKQKLIEKLSSIEDHVAFLKKQITNDDLAGPFGTKDEAYLMSEALWLVRASSEFLQNIGANWRADLVAQIKKKGKE